MKKPKILIGTPHAGDFSSESVIRLFSMAKELTQYDLHIRVVDTSLIHVARNGIFFDAEKHGYDYLLFIDSDMIWPIESLEQMIALDKDVVTGVYVQRYWPHRPTIYVLSEKYILIHIDDFPKDEPFRIEACGCGYMLIRKNVLQAFTDEVIEEMGQPFNLAMMPMRIKKQLHDRGGCIVLLSAQTSWLRGVGGSSYKARTHGELPVLRPSIVCCARSSQEHWAVHYSIRRDHGAA